MWCVGNESQQVVNRSVDGDVLWVLLDGLLPESMYRVQVAAVTIAGVGIHSQPVFIILSEYRHNFHPGKSSCWFLAGLR